MMFKAKTVCDAKVVNLELNFHKKQFKSEMKIDLLKCLWVIDARILFQVVWRPHLRVTVRSSKPANLAISVILT